MRPPCLDAKPSWTFPPNNIRLFFKSPTVDFHPNHPKKNAPAQSANPKLPVAEKNLRYAPRLGSPPQRGAPPKAVRGTLSPHTQPPTTKHTPPPPAARRKRTPKPHDTAAIRSADKSPARLKMDQARALTRCQTKDQPTRSQPKRNSRAPFSKWAIKGICPKRVRPHAFSLPFSRRKRKCRIVKGRIAP